MAGMTDIDHLTDEEKIALGYRRVADFTGGGLSLKDNWVLAATPHPSTQADENRCSDCGVLPGMQHDQGCDVARCISTGEQWIQCEGEEHEYHGRWYGRHEGLCLPEVWTGTWPGESEAVEFGWYSYFDHGWHRCAPDHPGAQPDLNRLNGGECVWSAELCRWVLKTSTAQ